MKNSIFAIQSSIIMAKSNKGPQKVKSTTNSDKAIASSTAAAPKTAPSYSITGILVVLAVTFIVFYTCVNNQFVNWDDEDNFIKNPFLKVFDFASIKGIFTQTILGNYNPMPIFSFAIERALSGSQRHHVPARRAIPGARLAGHDAEPRIFSGDQDYPH